MTEISVCEIIIAGNHSPTCSCETCEKFNKFRSELEAKSEWVLTTG